MATSKPISSISYNTDSFLIDRLTALSKSEVISFWSFIHHKAEKGLDEVPGKDHIHLFVMPNKLVDLMKFQKEFTEIDPAHLDKPFRCMPFRTSKPSDWILYALHNIDYLALKGMDKEFHYLPEEIICSDPDFLSTLLAEAFQGLVSQPVVSIRNAVANGLTFDSLVYSGRIPLPMVNCAKTLYESVKRYQWVKDNSDFGPTDLSSPFEKGVKS